MRLIVILSSLLIWVSVGIRPLISDYLYAQYIHTKDKTRYDYLKQAVNLNKGDTIKLSELAKVYLMQKNFASAHALLIEVLNHTNGDVVPWTIWTMRAVCEVQMGQFDAAYKSIDRALTYNPEFTGAVMMKKNLDKAKTK